jgi:two-component system nitrogen regulation response regulator GlnG
VDFFLQKAKQEFGIDSMECSSEVLELFKTYRWPGNVRELENAIKRAVLLSPNQVLIPIDFPDLLEGEKSPQKSESLEALVAQKLENSLARMNLKEMNNLYEMVLHQVERPLINIVLQKTRGNQIRTADILGINRNTLRKKIKLLEIEVKRGG